MIYNDTCDLCNEWTLVQLRSWAWPPHQFQYLGWELGGGGTGSACLDLRGTCHKLVHEGLRQHGGLFCSHETTLMPCVLSDESPTNGHRSPTYRFRQLSSLEALGDLEHLEPRQLGTG